mmetsp:Transcript_1001/g.2513  ORF Transcript_1001/g.2513 Transcript_1001/m.2513 type:complete len:203 (+) Transcript_1001:1023-1631(+)
MPAFSGIRSRSSSGPSAPDELWWRTFLAASATWHSRRSSLCKRDFAHMNVPGGCCNEEAPSTTTASSVSASSGRLWRSSRTSLASFFPVPLARRGLGGAQPALPPRRSERRPGSRFTTHRAGRRLHLCPAALRPAPLLDEGTLWCFASCHLQQGFALWPVRLRRAHCPGNWQHLIEEGPMQPCRDWRCPEALTTRRPQSSRT